MNKIILPLLLLFAFAFSANAEWRYNPLMHDELDYYIGVSDDIFVPYTGATQNVDIGTWDLLAGTIYATDTGVSEFTEGALFGTTLTVGSGSITDSTGAISFGNENLSTTGTLGAGAITGTSYTIGANTLNTSEWAYLDGQNQALKTTDDVIFDDITGTRFLDSSMVADWDFVTNANDCSMYGNDGTGGTYTNGYLNSSVATFTSKLASFSGLSAITVSANVYLSDGNVSTNAPILSLTGAGGRSWGLFAESTASFDGKVRVILHNGTSTIFSWVSTADYNTGQWYNVIVRGSSAGNAILINGVAAAGTYVTGSSSTNIAFDQITPYTAMVVGSTASVQYVSKMRIFNRYLTDAEAQCLYNKDKINKTFGQTYTETLGVGAIPTTTALAYLYFAGDSTSYPWNPTYGCYVNMPSLSNSNGTHYAYYANMSGDNGAKIGFYCNFGARTNSGDVAFLAATNVEEGATVKSISITGAGCDYFGFSGGSPARLYPFYNGSTGHMFMGSDNSMSIWGTGDASCILYDDRSFIINPKLSGSADIKLLNTTTIADPATLGAEKVSNPSYAGPFTGWTATNWTFVDAGDTYNGIYNAASHNSGNTSALSQASASMVTPIVIGELYYLKFYLDGVNSGTITPSCGGWTGPVITPNASYRYAYYEYVFTATSTAALAFTPSSTANIKLYNITLKKITGGVLNVGDDVMFGGQARCSNANYRRYYHLQTDSFDPGASGATWVSASANTLSGWQVNVATENLEFDADIHSDWDGVSDLQCEIVFALLDAGVNNDTVDLRLRAYYNAVGDTATKTQTVEVATTTTGTQYKVYKAVFTIDYDAVSNVVESGDRMSFILNLETDTSEIDNVIINHITFFYNTTHVGIESTDV